MTTGGDVTGDKNITLGEVLESVDSTRAALLNYDEVQVAVSATHKQHEIDAERSLLGGLIIGGLDVMDDIEDVGLTPSDFQRDQHGLIFGAIVSLHTKRKPIDSLSIVDELNRVAQLDNAGGIAQVSMLESLMPTTAHCPAYAKIVANNSRRRHLARIGRIVTRRAERGVPWDEVADYAETELITLQQRRVSSDFVDMNSTVSEALQALPALGGTVTGELTGFLDLDSRIRLREGELIIIAARPSMGKTAFALDIFRHLTVTEQKPCVFFSLEMDAKQLVTRQLAGQSRVPGAKRSPSAAEIQRLNTAALDIASAPQFIDETPGISIGEIRARTRALHRKHNLHCVFADYLGLIGAPNKDASPQQQIADVSKLLKQLARELRIPVVCLSQLNRGVEQRPNKRPVMSDLRDSGAVEQDADIICFLYRDEYYYGTSSSKPNIAEAIIAKNRNGPTDTVELHYTKNLPRFDNLSRGP